MVCSEEKRIKQILMNLQSNALKFTKESGDIRIIVEFIKRNAKKKATYGMIAENFADFSSSSEDSQPDSDNQLDDKNKKKDHHKLEEIF